MTNLTAEELATRIIAHFYGQGGTFARIGYGHGESISPMPKPQTLQKLTAALKEIGFK